MSYAEFFKRATRDGVHPHGLGPFRYQRRLAEEPWPELLDVPTGMGKTAAVTLAWLWKSLHGDRDTPRRLIWCLPMRVLVEQTKRNVDAWLENVAASFGDQGVALPKAYLLIGGEVEDTWTESPKARAILVGTQDMLLSRGLMRGYGMSRYLWPVHFALLHNDAFWVFDEVQLMGPGLATGAQLEAFRRSAEVKLGNSSRSLWISATLNPSWLATVDFARYLNGTIPVRLSSEEKKSSAVRQRREAVKRLRRASTELGQENSKAGAKAYAAALVDEIAARHRPGTQTLVVVNTVERAQAIYQGLAKRSDRAEQLLVHARFRSAERGKINERLRLTPDSGRIVVATQAVEAGVDISSATLFIELASWSSVVQRFGRCNRYGECTEANVFWIDLDVETDIKLALPYGAEALASARERLRELKSASPANLPPTDESAPLWMVLRHKDLLDLFNTDSDLSGFDIDVSPYIRDAEEIDAAVFWRVFDDPNAPAQRAPSPDELCRASLTPLREYLTRVRKVGRGAYRWDSLSERWLELHGDPRPGMVLMLDAGLGGYDAELGFFATSIEPVTPLPPPAKAIAAPAAYGSDPRSVQPFVELGRHLADVEDEARNLCAALREPFAPAVARAARWHDVGKAHAVFQKTLTSCADAGGKVQALLAKSPCRRKHDRRYFRHELASMLAWLAHHGHDSDADLIAYLVAAHHGKVRMSLRALPDEEPTDDPQRRFARGIWEGDEIPVVEIQGREQVPATTLRLDLMSLGDGPDGPSWVARAQRLLREHGPFRLSWLETLVRIADWRASRKELEGDE